MTEEEKIICKEFLNDADTTHSCNEYKLLMALLEQDPKSEWEQDHAILKAYSDGANDVLDKVRAEIMSLDYIDEDKYEGTSISPMIDREDVLEIIDMHKAESEG